MEDSRSQGGYVSVCVGRDGFGLDGTTEGMVYGVRIRKVQGVGGRKRG